MKEPVKHRLLYKKQQQKNSCLVRFVLVWICRFPLPLGVWEGLRFVIVALPGLFFYLLLVLINLNLDIVVHLVCQYISFPRFIQH